MFIFLSAAKQEKEWAKFLFQNGPVLGLNEKMLNDYVDYLLLRRMKAIGLSADVNYKGNHPLPWIEKHFTSSNAQVAPQEVEISSYLSATSLLNDVQNTDFDKIWNQQIQL